MRDGVIVDEMDKIIAMVAFVNASIIGLNESDPSRPFRDREIFGFREIMFHIERELEEINDCLCGCGEALSFKEIYPGMPVPQGKARAIEE